MATCRRATTISESVSLPDRCRLVSQQLTSANGTPVTPGLGLPRLVMFSTLHNTYGVTNTVECTSDLTLVKDVANGPASSTSWNLAATAGEGDLSGPQGTSGVTQAVTPGTGYVLSETGGTDALADLSTYTQKGAWSCTGGSLTGGNTISIPFTTAAVTCTVTNETARLVLKKVVTNTHGGSAQPKDFTLTAMPTGGETLEKSVVGSAAGASIWVRPGTSYALSESGPVGYSLESLTCDGQKVSSVTVAAQETVTCTFTNVDKAAYLTLRKVVQNGQTGATHVGTEWLLSAADVDHVKPTVSGHEGDAAVTHGEILPGTYHLDEDGPAGYQAGSWSCTGGTLQGSDVTVALDQSVVCSITNTAKPSSLELVKVVDTNGTGDGATAADWTLTGTPVSIAGQDPVSGPGGAKATVRIGSYSLAESTGPSGYTPSAWSCVGGSQDGATVGVALGEDVVCTIRNTAIPAAWTVEKSSTTTPTPLLPGGVIHYTLQAHHTAGVAAKNVLVKDDLSGLLLHGSVTSVLPGNVTVVNGLLTWTIGSLAGDEVLHFDITLAGDAWGSTCPTR